MREGGGDADILYIGARMLEEGGRGGRPNVQCGCQWKTRGSGEGVPCKCIEASQEICVYHKLIHNFGSPFSSAQRVSSIQSRRQNKREIEGSEREDGRVFSLSSGLVAGRRFVHRPP